MSHPRLNLRSLSPSAGFTFIEVLIAMLIFTIVVISAVELARGSVRATRDSRQVSEATWLVQKLMVDLETKIETEGIEKGCEEEVSGKFPSPNERFSWTTYCYPVDFRISEAASQLVSQTDDTDQAAAKENQLIKAILDVASQYMTQSLRELHAEVKWVDGKEKRSISLTTHAGRFDLKPSVPNLSIPGAPAGGSGG